MFDTRSDCRSVGCTLLINIFFYEYQLRIPPFCHVCLYFFSAVAAIFVGITGNFEEKLTREICTTFLYACF